MERNTNSLAIKFGITGGLIFAILAFACWAGGINFFANFLMIYTWVPVILVLVLIGAFRRRKQLGGYMSFKEALVFAFLAYVIYEVFYSESSIQICNRRSLVTPRKRCREYWKISVHLKVR
jgi:hypothetical protein